MPDSIPDTSRPVAAAVPPGSIAVPLSLAVSLFSAAFALGGAYFMVTRTAVEVESLRARVDDHTRTSAHLVTGERLTQIDGRLLGLEKAIADQRSTHDDIVKIGANVRALCQASRAANCAP